MPIDASIPLGIKPVQIENPVNQLARLLQVQGLQQDQQLGRMKMDEYQRGIFEKNRLTSLLQGGGNSEALRKAGFLKEALEWDEKAAKIGQDQAQAKKYGADAEKTALETNIQKVSFGAQLLSTARDQASYDRARMEAQANGLDVSRMPPQFDPAFVQSKLQESMSIKEQLEQQWKQKGYDLDVRKVEETGRHNRATEGISAGQLRVAQGNLGLRSQELEHSRSQPRGQFIETTDGFVLADPKSGAVRAVTGPDGKPLKGKAADRQMTDSQAKANLFGSRMKESDRILTEMEGKYSPMAVNAKMAAAEIPGIGGAAGYAGNLMLSEKGQQAEQAQRDFINAVLRRESGAVISAPEFANGQKQYFPQPGDSPAVLAQKRRNRALAIRGMEAEVPGGFRSAPSLTNPGNEGGSNGRSASGKVTEGSGEPSVDELVKKYGGK